jgi:GTP-binding protein
VPPSHQTPTIAIVGRPNVGKSTLFNRLVGWRQSIVHDEPGVTRDRVVGQATLDGERKVHVIDTGGLLIGEADTLSLGLNDQVWMAIAESDLLIFVVDGKTGLTTADEEVAAQLRKVDKPMLLVVNKSDVAAAAHLAPEFYVLGIEPLIELSAEHGLGFQDLHDHLNGMLPWFDESVEEDDVARIALVGRPNVGKSSLLNRLLGEERALVSPTAGTTRDPIDTTIQVEGKRFMLVDTAGIRRRSKTSGAPEALAVMMAKRQLERADLALLVIEAQAGVSAGDLAIAGAAWEMGRAIVVLVNKWDLIDEKAREDLEMAWERLATIAADPERVNVSAMTARSVEKIFPAAERALEAYRTEVSTSDLNRLVENAVRSHNPPTEHGKPWKVFYSTQVKTGPPTFLLFANRLLPKASTYRRYLENTFRRVLELRGIPIRLVIRRRSEPRGGQR